MKQAMMNYNGVNEGMIEMKITVGEERKVMVERNNNDEDGWKSI